MKKPMGEPESAAASDCSQKEAGTRLQQNSNNFLRLERETRSAFCEGPEIRHPTGGMPALRQFRDPAPSPVQRELFASEDLGMGGGTLGLVRWTRTLAD